MELTMNVCLQPVHGGDAQTRDDVTTQNHRADKTLGVLSERQAETQTRDDVTTSTDTSHKSVRAFIPQQVIISDQ